MISTEMNMLSREEDIYRLSGDWPFINSDRSLD